MILRAITGLLMLVSVSSDDRPAALAGDLARLQGRWEASIRTPIPDRRMTLRMTIRGTDVNWTAKDIRTGEDRTTTARLAIDESAAPKHWDMTRFTDTHDGASLPDLRGIYKLEGDELTLCVPPAPDDQRPTQFIEDTGLGPPCTVVFKRLGP